jgi:NAD(P)-dependent dehydrogenase (short-subunit alcohol dehydrogenase family)
VSNREAVDRAVAETGDVELLVANAGVSGPDGATWEIDPADWWHVQEINVLGVHLCCRAVIPGMLERGGGRIVITGSGAAYLPGSSSTATPRARRRSAAGRRWRTSCADPRLPLRPAW